MNVDNCPEVFRLAGAVAGASRSSLAAVSEQDRRRWDERYTRTGPVQIAAVAPPNFLQSQIDRIPTGGRALDVACGQGHASIWLASRGLDVWGVDISAVAVTQARDLARRAGFEQQCRFGVVDLDEGLPPGPPVQMLLCNKFRDPRLDRALIERLAPGGLLGICTLSEVGAAPGPFRAARGELRAAFGELTILAAGEQDGHAWLLGRA